MIGLQSEEEVMLEGYKLLYCNVVYNLMHWLRTLRNEVNIVAVWISGFAVIKEKKKFTNFVYECVNSNK